MLEDELQNLVRKIQKRQTEFQNIELKAASVDFPKKYTTRCLHFLTRTKEERLFSGFQKMTIMMSLESTM